MGNGLFRLDPIELSEIPRSRVEYPYSYDPCIVWSSGDECASGTLYSDRLCRDGKFLEIVNSFIGNERLNFGFGADLSLIENILKKYLSSCNLRIVRVVEYCNPSSGYPYWRVDYIE